MLTMEPEDTLIMTDLEAMKVYFDPFRRRIVGELVDQPRTIQEVAQRLGVPFTRLYYQFNLLEKHGIIRVVETRRMAGAIEEKYYRVAAYTFQVARHLLENRQHEHIPPDIEVVLQTVFDDARAEIERNILNGRINLASFAPSPDALLARRGYLRLPPEEASRFMEELLALVKRYFQEPAPSDAPYYLLTFVVAPIDLSFNLPDEDETQ
jgi:DNA-binding transcriptional ArsR family regulator